MSEPSKQWKVSWSMWPLAWPKEHRTEKIHADEAEARSQLEGLLSMKAPHRPRPCDKHVWDISLQFRTVIQGEWQQAEGRESER